MRMELNSIRIFYVLEKEDVLLNDRICSVFHTRKSIFDFLILFMLTKDSFLVDTVKDRKETEDLKTIRKYEIFSAVWRGLFEPSTVPFHPERKRV